MANKLVEMISAQAAKYGAREAFTYKDPETTYWKPTSWNKFAEHVEIMGYALQILGVKEGERIAVFSNNCPQILETNFGAFRNRAVPVPMYATSSQDQVNYIVKDAEINVIFVGNQSQYAIARRVLKSGKQLSQIVSYDENIVLHYDDDKTITYRQLLKMGYDASDEVKEEVNRRTAAGTEEDMACLIYTSGTTGEPKGVILTHANFDCQMETHAKVLPVDDTDRSLCFLPLSHIFECAWTYFCLTTGIRIAINYNPKEIQLSIRETRPTVMCSVPRFWEKVYAAVQDKLGKMPPLQRKLVQYAIKVGKEYNLDHKRNGIKPSRWLKWKFDMLDRYVLHTLRRAIGVERGRFFPTAGAPISDNICSFLHSCGINIVVGYGLSETTATVSFFPQEGFEIGSIGRVLPSLEVKIGPEDEILLKGPSVMKGYYNKPAENEKAFTADGFFRTGDIGKFTAAGSLVITDRLKDLFKTSNGKYIAPQALESVLGEDKFIEQVAIIGDQRKYVTAIIIPAFDALKEYAAKRKIVYKTVDDLVKNSEIYRMIEDRINRLQKNFASFEQVKKFTLLAHEFTMESGELTNTLKIRRSVINKLYKKEIEAMYV
ncbi:MAG: long-chain fatty acid--CoA ligase [Bacteroidales bacterium]|nr:long-chain fatty acid--CoA ligase [Bacteroidales bacterium]